MSPTRGPASWSSRRSLGANLVVLTSSSRLGSARSSPRRSRSSSSPRSTSSATSSGRSGSGETRGVRGGLRRSCRRGRRRGDGRSRRPRSAGPGQRSGGALPARTGAPRLTEQLVLAGSSPSRRSPAGSTRYPPRPHDRRDVRPATQPVDGARLVGCGRRDRPRQGRGRRTGSCPRRGRARRWRGRWRADGRARSAARCSTAWWAWLPLSASSSSGSSIGGGSSRCTRSTSWRCSRSASRSVLQSRPRLHECAARGAPARLPRSSAPRGSDSAAGREPRLCPGPSGCSRRRGLRRRASGSASTPRRSRGVIDVGFAGVIGADRILHGQAPYGHMPVETAGPPAARPTPTARSATGSRQNGRCEPANARGDTYGPIAYLAYVPAVLRLGWSGKWDSLPAAHATAIGFDLLVVLGLVPRRTPFRRHAARGHARVRLGRLPFTAYAMNANYERRDHACLPRLGVLALELELVARGGDGLAGWTKFASLLLAPLWLTYPNGLAAPHRGSGSPSRSSQSRRWPCSRSCCSSRPREAVRTFVDRTLGYQLGRDSPFSPWDWGQYHASGIPDLKAVQTAAPDRRPRARRHRRGDPCAQRPARARRADRRRPVGFELVLTHWSYLYIPWFLPFVLLALLLPGGRGET